MQPHPWGYMDIPKWGNMDIGPYYVSDHDPITLSLTIDWSIIGQVSRHHVSKCKWHEAVATDLLSYK